MSPEAMAVRDAAEALLAPLALADQPLFKTVSAVPLEFEPGDDLPGLIVALTREQMSPEGDANSGEVRFINDLTLTLFVSLFANSREKADERLSTRSNALLQALLRDQDFVSEIESFEGITSSRIFRKDGERFFADLRMEVTIRIRTQWGPPIEDLLERVEIISEFSEVATGLRPRARVVLPTS